MHQNRLDFIDFAKAFAILSIVLYHYSEAYAEGVWAKAVMLGGTGVHLFFILSGFGLAVSAAKLGILDFYKKRFLRILIPYYIIILLIYFVNKIIPLYPETGLYALFGHLFFYKMFDESIIFSLGDHFWFISTIIQFYLIYPLIIYLRNKASTSVFLLFSLLISTIYWIATAVFEVSHLHIYESFFLQYLWEFNLGIVLAERYRQQGQLFWQQNPLLLLIIAVLGLGLMALMVVKGGQIGKTFNDVPASLGYLALTCLCFWFIAKIKVALDFFIYIGKISYELYLTHMFIFFLAYELSLLLIETQLSLLSALLIVFPFALIFAHYYASLMGYIYAFLQKTPGK